MKFRIDSLPVNTQGRDFIVGDIHGCFSLFEKALLGVNFDPSVDRIISVGDIIDRGDMNEVCLYLLKENWFYSVIGNHELMMYDALTIDNTYGLWIRNGGHWGLEYLSGSSDRDFEIRDLITEVANLPIILTLELPENKKVHVIHAELGHIYRLTDKDLLDSKTVENIFAGKEDALLWGRLIFGTMYNEELTDDTLKQFNAAVDRHNFGAVFSDELSPIYSGHTIVRNPLRFKGQTNIDTGAFKTLPHWGNSEWAGLTITEPATDRFWKASLTEFKEIQPTIIG